ncbi:MAG: protein kinase, partial [Polyangiaceae bacterium]
MPSQHRVGEYELDQELARGGSGVVYLARRVGSSKLVALKLAREDVLDRAGVRALFREEAEAGGALDYPYIGRVIGSGVHEGLPFLVLPLMEGGTLEDPHNRSRFERPGAALELISKIASAVEFAHSRGILHCDLKAA